MKSIDSLIEQIRSISSSALIFVSKKNDKDDDLFHLVKALNEMLDRLEKSSEEEKSLIYHISHGLRTPYSLILAEIELNLMKDRSRDEYIRAMKSISAEVKNINRFLDDLLISFQIRTDASLFKFRFRVDEALLQSSTELLKRNRSILLTRMKWTC